MENPEYLLVFMMLMYKQNNRPRQKQITKYKTVRLSFLHTTGDYHSREPGCVTNMLRKLDLPTLQDRCKQQHLSFFRKGLIPAMPTEQLLKPLPARKRQIRPAKFQDFRAKNIIDRQETLNSRPFLVSHSKYQTAQEFFYCLHCHQLEPPQ